METILTLDQTDLTGPTTPPDRTNYHTRHAARAVLTDNTGGIALLHTKVRDYYKLPGGGIEENEDKEIALAREIQEETGCQATITGQLGKIVEWRDITKLKQISYCYTARLIGEKGLPSFTEGEIEEGFELVWANSISEALQLVAQASNSEDLNVRFMTLRDSAILKAAQ